MKLLIAVPLLLLVACAHAPVKPIQLKSAPDTTAGTPTERAFNTGVSDGMYTVAKARPNTGLMVSSAAVGFLFPIPGMLAECFWPRHPSPVPSDLAATVNQRGPDYFSGYQKGYGDQSRKKKRNEACGGAAMGTSLAFAIFSALMLNH